MNAPLYATAFEAGNRSHLAGLIALFEAASSPCYCRYWHFAGDKNAWLARCAFEPDENRRELETAASMGSDEATGVVAFVEGTLAGWLKLAPVASLPKMYAQRLYRGLAAFDGERGGVLAVGCTLVHPQFRRAGVAHALARVAVDVARAHGAAAIEALPRAVDAEVSDEELWMGPIGAFEAAGFTVVHTSRPYPVLRLDLEPSPASRTA